MVFFPLITACLMLAFGISALWLNPRRGTNRVLAAIAFMSVAVFAAQLMAKHFGAKYLVDQVSNPVPWIRLKFALIAIISPFLVWICYYVVSGRYRSRRALCWKLAPWAALSVFLFLFAFTEAFKPNDSLPGNVKNGPLYLLYFIPMLGGQIAVCASAIVIAERLTGVRKVEFRFIAIALGYLSLAAVFVEVIYATWPSIPGVAVLTRILSYLVYIMFCVSSWSITTRRVYHSGQVSLSILQRFFVVAAVSVPTVMALHAVQKIEPNPFAEATIVAAAMLLFYYCDDKVRERLRLKPEQQTALVNRKLRAAAEQESDPNRYLAQCQIVIAEFAQTFEVNFLRLEADRYVGDGIILSLSHLRDANAFSDGWATPASLERVRTTASDCALLELMRRARLGAMVAPERDISTPTFLLAVGERENQLPYTYPEIRVFQDLARAIEAHYTGARLRLQARQAEQLAAIGRVGACVAHELRNPMETLRTFAEMLPERLNDREFLKDFAEVIPQEAERVHALAAQLLDMAKPRNYQFAIVDAHAVVQETARLLTPTAREKGTGLVLALEARQHAVKADANALRQVLINLIKNSVEAVGSSNGERMVTVRTRDDEHRFFIEVEDNGPGIPEDIRRKLFTPFATSGKKGGLGLGLAICEEIAKSHCGTIQADARPGGGSVFRVALPRYSPTSSISG